MFFSFWLLSDLSASTIPSAMQEGAGALRAVIKIGTYPFAPFRQMSRSSSLTAKSGAAFLSCSRAKDPDRLVEQSTRVRNTANADLPTPYGPVIVQARDGEAIREAFGESMQRFQSRRGDDIFAVLLRTSIVFFKIHGALETPRYFQVLVDRMCRVTHVRRFPQ